MSSIPRACRSSSVLRARRWRPLAFALLVTATLGTPLAQAAGTAMGGRDQTRILPPPGAVVVPYENAGYRLTLDRGEARVEVDLTPLESVASFRSPPVAPSGAVGRLAYALTAGSDTEYDAVSRVLGWLSSQVRYSLDRTEAQDPETVLQRRRGYCTGIARLAVALLESVNIPAREVAGYVVDDNHLGTGGYHRWIEARLGDRGWVFSDPLASHHHVDARYLRLEVEDLDAASGLGGLLLERHDRRQVVDLYPAAAQAIVARRNATDQLAATVTVRLAARLAGTATLEGHAMRHARSLRDGSATFVGLDPGRYALRLELTGGTIFEREIELAGRVRTDLYLPVRALPTRRPRAAHRSEVEEAPR